ncbi:hypothetical protein APASM_2779 [Actinosynnema pretiosum subsp. pretiosum]|nr:hypothetical protein APASM_2779 [Actinosynnema pretiosum subsp. pretiosum]
MVLEKGAVRITGDIEHPVIPIGDIRDVEVVSTTSAVGLFISYPVLVKAEDDWEPLRPLRRLDVDGRPHPDVVARARALHDHVFGADPSATPDHLR